MKYVIWFFVIASCIIGGGAGALYWTAYDFEAKAGISMEAFNSSYDNCVQQAQEACNLYGGFAPLSQFMDSRK